MIPSLSNLKWASVNAYFCITLRNQGKGLCSGYGSVSWDLSEILSRSVLILGKISSKLLYGCWLKALVPHEGLSIRLVMIRFLLRENHQRKREKKKELKREFSLFYKLLLKWHSPTCAICCLLITIQFQYDVQGYCTRMNISKGKDHLRGYLPGLASQRKNPPAMWKT